MIIAGFRRYFFSFKYEDKTFTEEQYHKLRNFVYTNVVKKKGKMLNLLHNYI